MGQTHEENITGLKNTLSGNNSVYTTIKAQYTGSWNDDLTSLGNILGMSPNEILQLNPWLSQNAFPANDHDYAVIQLKQNAGNGGNTGNGMNNNADGYYVTNEWTFPLQVGKWFVQQGYKTSHTALDLTTGTPGQIAGAPIFASKAGTLVEIRKAGSGDGGWGNAVLIRHDDTKDTNGNCYYTRYAHMSTAPTQKVGDKISQGDQVGTVGSTGKSTGYHLHFQIYFTSATRTDYGNFTGSASFSVDPNNVENFPGKPFKEGTYTQINFEKSQYVEENDIESFIRAIQGTEAEDPITKQEFNTVKDRIINKILNGLNVSASSDLGKYLTEYLNAQFDGIANQGLNSVNQLLSGGNFFYTLENFCQTVVNNSIWYIENKVGEVLVSAGQSFIVSTKEGLKNWIFSATDVDPSSDLAQELGGYLDGYVDTIVNLGWSAVRTAISTGDVRSAAEILVTNTKNASIDYVANVMVHSACKAVQAYIPTLVKDPVIAEVATSIATGVINTTIQSIGGVLKGQISIEQAAKNIISSAVISITSTVLRDVVQPVLQQWITNGMTSLVISALESAGIAIGSGLGGIIGGIIGAIVGYVLSALINFLVQKLVGFFTQ